MTIVLFGDTMFIDGFRYPKRKIRMDELTIKQQKVMRMLIADVPTAEIAYLLDKTQRDVQYLIAESIKRIGARTRSGAIAILVRREEYSKKTNPS